MEQREFMQRGVGILTEALEMRRQLRADPDAVTNSGAVSKLLEEMLPHIELPADAGAREVADIVTAKLGPAIVQITSALAFAFVQLAEVHDAGRTDVSSTDVLRSISLHYETGAGEEAGPAGAPPRRGGGAAPGRDPSAPRPAPGAGSLDSLRASSDPRPVLCAVMTSRGPPFPARRAAVPTADGGTWAVTIVRRSTGRRRPVAFLSLILLVLAAALGPTPSAAADGDWWDPTARPSPDSGIGVTGEPFKGTNSAGEVRGFVDAHNHIMSNEAFGGRLICGKPFSDRGVAEARKDCPEHYPDGSLAVFDFITNGGDGRHDPVGWPSFKDWPAHDALTHQQNYYAWIERAWRGGQRVLVNDLVTNGVICSVYFFKDRSCDEMTSIRLQAQLTYDMQDFVDRMYGGPGKGWFRVVTDSAQARHVVEQGKLAVVLGVETSEPFGCKQILDIAQCDRADIDAGLDELYDLGVRSMFLCHKFDNALCGVRFDSGALGTAINVGQFLSTGTFWRTEKCTGPQRDNPIGLTAAPGAEQKLPDGVDLPRYAEDAQCNVRGLTDLGEYAVRGMMKRNMMLEIDHMSVKATGRVLDILEAESYPGVISSHSWMDLDWTDRV